MSPQTGERIEHSARYLGSTSVGLCDGLPDRDLHVPESHPPPLATVSQMRVGAGGALAPAPPGSPDTSRTRPPPSSPNRLGKLLQLENPFHTSHDASTGFPHLTSSGMAGHLSLCHSSSWPQQDNPPGGSHRATHQGGEEDGRTVQARKSYATPAPLSRDASWQADRPFPQRVHSLMESMAHMGSEENDEARQKEVHHHRRLALAAAAGGGGVGRGRGAEVVHARDFGWEGVGLSAAECQSLQERVGRQQMEVHGGSRGIMARSGEQGELAGLTGLARRKDRHEWANPQPVDRGG